MTEYDIAPSDNPPTFEYDEGEDWEQDYVLALLLLLEGFYDKYKHKSVDDILKTIEADGYILVDKINNKTETLDDEFDETRDELLIAAGILLSNIPKTKITSDEIDDLKEEQRNTTLSIIMGMVWSIKGKASRAKYRNTEDIFSIDSNVRTATTRLTNMGSTGVRDARGVARLTSMIYLYGDPLVDWITMNDDAVCPNCWDLQIDSPIPMSKCPEPPLHPHCFEKETEVFTNHGWQKIIDVSSDDLILTLNPDTNLTEFVPFTEKFVYENTKDYLYHIYNKWFDCKVTYDHDIFIHQRVERKGKKVKIPKFAKPHELNSESYILRTCDNHNISRANFNIHGFKIDVEDYVTLLAWYLSDGNCQRDEGIAISCHEKSTKKRKIMVPFLERFSEKYNITVWFGKEKLYINSKELNKYFKPLGKSNDKYIPSEIFDLSKEHLNLFLDNYVLCDGHYKECSNDLVQNSSYRNVCTTSKKLADGLSYVILLAGYCPSFYIQKTRGNEVTFKNGTYTINHDLILISINRSNYASIRNCTVEKMPYTDDVVCLEVPPYNTLLIKSNGKVSWNGNCRCETKLHEDNPQLTPDAFDLTFYGIL